MNTPTVDTVCWSWTDTSGKTRATVTFSASAYRLGLWDAIYCVHFDDVCIGSYPYGSMARTIAQRKCVETLKREFKEEYRKYLQSQSDGKD